MFAFWAIVTDRPELGVRHLYAWLQKYYYICSVVLKLLLVFNSDN